MKLNHMRPRIVGYHDVQTGQCHVVKAHHWYLTFFFNILMEKQNVDDILYGISTFFFFYILLVYKV